MTATKDLIRLIENARPTEDELEKAFYYLAERMKPTKKEANLITLAETWDEAQKLAGDEQGIGGLSTGFPSIDNITGGLRPGQLIIAFGDTGHGKSMFVQNVTKNVAAAGSPVLFIGLEMTNAENTERLQNMGATIDLPVLYPSDIDLEYKSVEASVKAGVEQGIELVVIDHLHMWEGLTSENEPQFITAVCREMKMLAIKYKLPIILVSHIKERREGTEGNIPVLRDLKGSSSIKQLADSALAVFNEGMVNDDLMSAPELIIKQRKSRRGRQQTLAKLRILSNARLAEQAVYSPLP